MWFPRGHPCTFCDQTFLFLWEWAILSERGRECGPKAEPKRGCDSVERGWNVRPQADPGEDATVWIGGGGCGRPTVGTHLRL